MTLSEAKLKVENAQLKLQLLQMQFAAVTLELKEAEKEVATLTPAVVEEPKGK